MNRCPAPIPFPSGVAYRITSPPRYGLVTPRLAAELGRVLDRFARDAGFTAERPVRIGLQPGILGHHKVDRAADIYFVEEIRLDRWKRRWDRVRDAARRLSSPEERARRLAAERRANLGWRLYRAMARVGRWAQPYGYPIQLFGPWTREEGPFRFISDRLLHAHRDHIHVSL